MAKFLRIAPFSGFVEKDFANETDVWLTCDYAFEGTGAGFDNNYGYIIDVSFGAFSWSSTCGVWWNGFTHKWQDDNDSGEQNASPTPTAVGTQHTMELHIVSGATVDCFIDGSSVLSGSEFYGDPINKARFGADRDNGDVIYIDNIKIGTTRGGTDIFSEDFEGVDPLSNFDVTDGDLSIVSAIDAPPVTPITGPPTYEWRFAVAKLNGRILSWLARAATQQDVTVTLNKARVASGVVSSDNPAVYLPQNDGFPILEEGIRTLLGFRKESVDSPKWVCRFAGLILQVEDNADESAGAAPVTTYTAYDPWQLAYKRPLRDADGNLPGPNGLTFTGQNGNEIVKTLIDNSVAADGELYIANYSDEVCDVISKITFQQDVMLGEALDQIVETGNLDLTFEPIYDPVGFPGMLCVLIIEKLRGYNYDGTPNTRHKSPLSWDKPRRNMVSVNRLKDGTQRANEVSYSFGQGGPAVGTESDFDSINQYGEYWTQQTFPGENEAAVELLAAEYVLTNSKGSKTYRVNPVPGSLGQIDSPILFVDYDIGSILPMFASSRFRHEVAVGKRVVSIPIKIRDDGVETIEGLEFGEGEVEVS